MENFDDMQRARMVGAFDMMCNCIAESLKSKERLKWLRKIVNETYNQYMLTKHQTDYLVSWIDERIEQLDKPTEKRYN